MQAYFDCRRTKRNSNSALEFELNLERNLATLATGAIIESVASAVAAKRAHITES